MALWWGVIWSTSLAATCRWVRLVFIPTKNLAKAGTEVRDAGLPAFIPGAWIRERFFCLWMPHLIPPLTLASHFNILCFNHQTKMSTPPALPCPRAFGRVTVPSLMSTLCFLLVLDDIILTTPAHYGLSCLWILIFCIWKTFCHQILSLTVIV